MNKRDVAFLACRVLGLYAWIYVAFRVDDLAAAVLVFLTQRWTNPDAFQLMLLYLGSSAPLLVYLGVGAGLWFGSGRLSKRMVRGCESEDAGVAVDAGTVQVIAYSVVGLVVLVWAIPALTAMVMAYVVMPSEASVIYNYFDWRWKMGVAERVIQIVIGLWLLFGARGIVGAVNRLRRAGLKAKDGGG